MTKNKKIMFGIIFACLFYFVGVYGYKRINNKNSFTVTEVNWNAETKFWTENTKGNVYDIKFQVFDGTDLMQINSEKSIYDLNIDSSVGSGELNLKVYSNEKVLLDTNGSTNKTISISKGDSKNVKIELIGKNAKGNIKIKLI